MPSIMLTFAGGCMLCAAWCLLFVCARALGNTMVVSSIRDWLSCGVHGALQGVSDLLPLGNECDFFFHVELEPTRLDWTPQARP